MIHVGIGGWTYKPWRGSFYPEGLRQADELAYAGEKLTAIEINGTFYRTQSATSFAKWRDAVPEGFKFTVKGHRAVVNRKVLAETEEAVTWFFGSGIAELGDRLGPVLWQFAPYKKFDPEDFGAFFALLPREVAGVAIRHAVEVRSKSFLNPDFVALARAHNVAVVFADSDDYPAMADVTSDFVYARLQRTVEDEATGYGPDALDTWADRAGAWARGETPDALPTFADPAAGAPRDVFVFMIAGAKIRAPHAAMALIERL
ncbi:MAG: DUF72 domain-containing protein [Alphaproteobacteria bacterium]